MRLVRIHPLLSRRQGPCERFLFEDVGRVQDERGLHEREISEGQEMISESFGRTWSPVVGARPISELRTQLRFTDNYGNGSHENLSSDNTSTGRMIKLAQSILIMVEESGPPVVGIRLAILPDLAEVSGGWHPPSHASRLDIFT